MMVKNLRHASGWCAGISRLRLLFAASLVAWGIGTAAGQNITATITSANAPSGTQTSPHFVIDSDASNANPDYDRDSVPASVEVAFNWTGTGFSGSSTFRATAQLIDADGDPVELASGGTSLASASQSVTLSVISPPAVRTFSLEPVPDADLGAGSEYSLRYMVQRQTTLISPGGGVVPIWINAAGPEDSAPFTVVHFTDDPGGAGRAEHPRIPHCRSELAKDPRGSDGHDERRAIVRGFRALSAMEIRFGRGVGEHRAEIHRGND